MEQLTSKSKLELDDFPWKDLRKKEETKIVVNQGLVCQNPSKNTITTQKIMNKSENTFINILRNAGFIIE